MCTVRQGNYHLVRNKRVCKENCSLCGTIYGLVWGGKTEGQYQGWELYDLAEDPGERNNLVEERPAVVERLGAAYDRWWEEVFPYFGDDGPRFANSNPLPFPAMYWRHYRGPGPNDVAPPEGFLESLDE